MPIDKTLKQKYQGEEILLLTRRSFVIPLGQVIRTIVLLAIFCFFISLFLYLTLANTGLIIALVIWLALTIFFLFVHYQIWKSSIFIVTNKRVSCHLRPTLFSHYSKDINLDQIIDVEQKISGILGFLLGLGTILAKSKAGPHDNFVIDNIPQTNKVKDFISHLLVLKEEERQQAGHFSVKLPLNKKKELVDRVINQVKALRGIGDAVVLSEADRQYIWQHEEERNHGVFECLARDVTIAMTHNGSFRAPEGEITVEKGGKVIFPPVTFSEIKGGDVVSSSPGWAIHEYLRQKVTVHDMEATLLLGLNFE